MRSVALSLIFVLATATEVEAGAWLREKGKTFASSSVTINQKRETFTSAYLEYGLTDRLTLGADIGYGFDLTGKQEGSGILFLRMPLGWTSETHKWAVHVGLGARYLNGEFIPAGELGVSWGRGIKWGEKYGWVNVDTSFNVTQAPAENRFKLDGTVGMGLTDKTKVMLQVFNTVEDGETFSKISPSILFSPGEGRTTFQLGTEIPIAGGGDPALKLGIWVNF